VQNDASSLVGQAVIQLAAANGQRTLNVARAHGKWAELASHLQALGATAVVSDDQAGRFEFARVLADMRAGRLGLNGAGGAAASAVARALAPSSTMVTYGAASGRPVAAPLSWFTARDLSLRGFSLGAAVAGMPKAALDAAVAEAVAAVDAGAVKLLVAKEPFADFAVALKRAAGPEHERAVVVTMA